MTINSRDKGCRGERELANKLKEYGFDCRRGQDGKFVKQKNQYVVKDDVIECYSDNGELLFFTDVCFENVLKQYSFGKLADGYSCIIIDGRQIPIHRFLINVCQNNLVDHINRNKKDNRLLNLRIANKSMNAMNSKTRCDNKSGHKGVYFRKDTGKWVAEIKIQYKKISLGCFKTKNEAIKTREDAEHKYWEECKCL